MGASSCPCGSLKELGVASSWFPIASFQLCLLCCELLCALCVATFQVPVVFFSLLRKGTPDRDRSEAKLAEAFDYVSGSYSNWWWWWRCTAPC